MRVLVAVASKYGATREIADVLGRTLAEHGVDAQVVDVGDVADLDGYDAVVLGSAVYAGSWLERARTFVERHGDELAVRPIWLFSSGPIGAPPRPEADKAVHVEAILALTKAREHRVFAGKLDKSVLGFGERAMVFAFRTEEGDFRDWDEIASWAAEIAAALGERRS